MGNKRHVLSSTAQEVPEPPNQSFHFSFSNLRRRSAKLYQSDEIPTAVSAMLAGPVIKKEPTSNVNPGSWPPPLFVWRNSSTPF
jgi:hypothetical protein